MKEPTRKVMDVNWTSVELSLPDVVGSLEGKNLIRVFLVDI